MLFRLLIIVLANALEYDLHSKGPLTALFGFCWAASHTNQPPHIRIIL